MSGPQSSCNTPLSVDIFVICYHPSPIPGGHGISRYGHCCHREPNPGHRSAPSNRQPTSDRSSLRIGPARRWSPNAPGRPQTSVSNRSAVSFRRRPAHKRDHLLEDCCFVSASVCTRRAREIVCLNESCFADVLMHRRPQDFLSWGKHIRPQDFPFGGREKLPGAGPSSRGPE